MPKMSTQTGARRASRLSEGTTRRALDYQISYVGKKLAEEILAAATRIIIGIGFPEIPPEV